MGTAVIITLLSVIFLGSVSTTTFCGDCRAILPYTCVSETQRVPCVQGVPDLRKIEACEFGFCSFGNCGSDQPSCRVCDVCSGPNGFACTARDKFKFCQNGTPVVGEISCPAGQVCDPSQPYMRHCHVQNGAERLRCEREPVMGPTTIAPTTISAEQGLCGNVQMMIQEVLGTCPPPPWINIFMEMVEAYNRR